MFSLRNIAATIVLALVASGIGVWLNGQLARGAYSTVTAIVTIDETDAANPDAPPIDDECPVGEPCKTLVDIDIDDAGKNVPSTTLIIPSAFSGADGTAVTNGHTTGKIAFSVVGLCALEVSGSGLFVDAAVKGEGADDGTAEALFDPNVWPTRLESDARVAYLLTNHSVIRRQVASVTAIVEIPVNTLYFDVSDGDGFAGLTEVGTYAVTVTGDPTAPAAACTPLHADTISVGETAEGELLSQCDVVGAHTFTTVFTHEDVGGNIVIDLERTDDVICSGPTTTPTPMPTPTITNTPTISPTPGDTPTPTSTPIQPPTNKMYWTDFGTDKIQRANLDGSNVEDLIQLTPPGISTSPGSIALDVAGGKMYWTDSGTDKIQRANLDGSNVEDLVTTGIVSPKGIALDVAGGKMYWADNAADKIQRANLDGTDVEDLVTGLFDAYIVALNVPGGKMYWADVGVDKIQRANLDGSEVEDLVTTGLSLTFGIALDLARGKMYWTDCGTDKIQRANLDGSEVEDLVTTGLNCPMRIALDVTHARMYWTDRDANKVQRANLDGSNVEDLVTGLYNPSGIALDVPAPTCDISDPSADPDVDGLTNAEEAGLNTDPCAPDTDGDGCTDGGEVGLDETLGGRRNPLSFWDFFDTPDPNATPQRDRMIRVDDIMRVVYRYGTDDEDGNADINRNSDPLSTPPKTGYHPAYDRGGVVGPNDWNLAPPDGMIRIADILAVVYQYGHTCA